MNEKIKHYGKYLMRKMPEGVNRCSTYIYYVSKAPFNCKKNINLLKYFRSVGKDEEISYAPHIFGVAVSTVCNLRCPTCLYLLKNPDAFSGGFIKVSDFKSTIEKYAHAIETVGLGGGEPLLHPHLDELVGIVKDNRLPVNISTNGILIKNNIETMKSFDVVNVSMDSYDYESFERSRGGTQKQFDDVMRGLDLLNENDIKFMISFLLTEENLDEIEKMINLGYAIKPDTILFYNINPHGSKFKPLTRESEKVNRILNEVTGKKDYPFDIQLPVVFDTASDDFKTSKCVQPWSDCGFDDKGDVSYCCHLQHDASVGNIFDDYDFNSDNMKDFRRAMMNHEYPEDCLYCDRRFVGEEYGFFSSRLKKWILS